MTNKMTAEEAIKWLKDIERSFPEVYFGEWRKALRMAIQALEAQLKPMEKFDDVKTHIQRLAGDYKCWDNRLTWEEALELNRMLEAQPTDAVSRGDLMKLYKEWQPRLATNVYEFGQALADLPPATPQRPNPDVVEKVRKAIDEMTEIHSDGEFYIKNVDAKWIISKYLCSAKEKPKGRWIATENEEMNIVGYYCSCCDLPMETEERTKYCPNCGAEMGGWDETN